MDAKSPKVKERPTVSVVVACRNEAAAIEDCLYSLLKQAPVRGGFEVLVVDGMSIDGTREKLRTLADQDPRVIVFDNPRLSSAAGFNVGVSAARGEYIAIVGAHNRYSRDYLRKCLDVALRTGADNVGGAPRVEGEGLVARAVALAHHSWLSVGGARWHDPDYEGQADTVFGGFYKREVFDRLHGYDEAMLRTEDDEFNLRLRKLGGTIYCSPEIRSWYSPRRSLRAVFAQYLQYGYYRVAVIKKHGRPASLRQIMPALCLSSWICAVVVGIFSRISLAIALVAALTYTIVVAATSLRSILSLKGHAFSADTGRVFLATMAVFVCFHVGYACGFIVGAFDLVRGRLGQRQRFQRLTRN